MEKYFEQIKASSIFDNIPARDIQSVCKELETKIKTYSKGDVIWYTEDSVSEIALILNGTVNVETEDFLGHKHLLRTIASGGYFCEAHSICDEKLMFNVVCEENETCIMFLKANNIIDYNKNLDIGYLLRKNFIKILANKSVKLNTKVSLLSMRTIKSKVLSLLTLNAKKQKSNYINIEYNRQEMADFLSIDRSALSKELIKMKEEKLIDYYKNNFIIYD